MKRGTTVRATIGYSWARGAAAATALCWATTGLAQDREPATPRPVTGAGEDITVTGWRLRQLDVAAPTGSRLGLSNRKTPATIDRIGADEILTRGFRTVEEATVSLPGVTSGGSPGDPSLFSMRGFTGEQITVLHNGLYLGPANMINRPGNTFNIAGIEVLKGPASVLYGQGAIGGAVNIVNKSPDFTADSLQALASYASFDTASVGLGGNHRIGDTLAARADVSYHRTDGFVDRAGSTSFNATGAVLFKPRDTLSIAFSVDYLEDNLSTYFGTPLVPASFAADPIGGILSAANGDVVDRRTRFINYNVSDNRAKSWQVWPRLVIDWSPSDHLSLSNTAYYFHADRQWINAENYVFDTTTKLIDRDRFFVFHNQDLFGDRFSLTHKDTVFGLANTLVVGIDYSHLDFVRSRGFPDGDSVDPLNPSPGLFGAIDKRVSPTRWDQIALFGEDALDLTPSLKLVTGVRAERLYFTRENFSVDGSFSAASSFDRTYRLFNWRAGLVYDVAPSVTAYASYSTGKDPVGANIFLVNAGQNFQLSASRQIEAGLKADLMKGRGSLTLAVYDIKRENILTQVAIDTVGNVGRQTSRGIEVSGEMRVTPAWAVIANGTYVDAAYGNFVDPNYGIAASGNTPPNVPRWVGNIWTTVQHIAGLPLEAGGGVKYVGKRYGNTANDLVLKPYATGIVYATYALTPRWSLTGRVNNVWNTTFVQWADIYYPAQVMLGEPRRFEVSVLARF
ncbi:iron complex outermembrane receptor protein [Sphingomonas sp. PP-CE-3G-477]|uniref:TonB-dependent receptor n=1 Tax=Sphingomonas sp. PP-CE-3G-477 TaxID=2135660 RepID=UPI000D35A0D9|nr:TonB-dependent receptor [Sphingomonas sp. PP-CE-3G-477]PTQ63388.1 iron complex outermembrane receptor protein [Sphingomonas sp. PP-CE-3G-477]